MGLGAERAGVDLHARVAEVAVLRRQVALRVLPALLASTLLVSACGGSGDNDPPAAAGAPEEVAQQDTGPPPCREARFVVAFDVAGFLNTDQDSWIDWINDPEAEPDVRPGAPELTHAYRAKGYEVLYITTVPPNVLIGGAPAPVAVEGWIERHGFAADEGTRVYGYTGTSDQPNAPVASITDELIRLAGQNVTSYAGYTENDDKAYAFASGGVPQERIYTISPNAGVSGTTAIPNDDLLAHRATIDALPPVCTPG
jgi:hypothetical protein